MLTATPSLLSVFCLPHLKCLRSNLHLIKCPLTDQPPINERASLQLSWSFLPQLFPQLLIFRIKALAKEPHQKKKKKKSTKQTEHTNTLYQIIVICIKMDLSWVPFPPSPSFSYKHIDNSIRID